MIKITISSIVIGLKNSYFPLIHLPSCYRTVCYRTARDKQIGLPLRVRPILLSLVWLQTELDSTQS